VTTESNRVGVRLSGRSLTRSRDGELPTEGMVAGSIQIPPSGQPIVFLADYPVTGGYPVLGVVREADLPVVAQARPGQVIRFRRCGTR
jgi:allophanate hydrolase subunit 2